MTLDPAQITQRYLAAFPDRWNDETPLEEVRFAVFDAETTSADARSAEAVTLGAITVEDGQILLEELFEAMIRLDHNLAAVTVHGITQQQSMAGIDEPEALLRFLDYLGDAVIIGHHIGFDITVMSRALERIFGFGLKNRSIDTMEIALLLHQDGVLDDPGGFSLDHLLSLFGIAPHDRHTAAGDAYLTAQVLQRLLHKATASGRTTLGAISERPARAAG